MRQSSYIDIDDFYEKYDLNKNSFESMKARGYFPKSIFRGQRYHIQIDENYFLLKKEKIKRIWLKAHDNYYTLTQEISEYKLSTLLHNIDGSKSINNWSMFLHEDLFSPLPEKITKTKLTKALYKFTRYSNWLIKRGLHE